MRKFQQFLIAAFVVVVGITFIVSASAEATNGHQDHRGACARSTTSIDKGLSDWRHNGVLGAYAKKMGFKKVDGSVTKQLRERLVVARVVKATRTNNEGCNGRGGRFSAGKRTLNKGEKVVIKLPAKYAKSDLCTKASATCKRVRITVSFAAPVSCWNGNSGRVVVEILVREPKKSTPKPPAAKPTDTTPVCVGGGIWNGVQCVVQSNANETKQTAEQECSAIVNGTWNGSQCIIIQNNTTNQTNNNEQTVTNVCSNVNSPGGVVHCDTTPPPPAQKCPDGRPVPKDGCDRPPVVNIMGSPAHLYVGGNAYVWIEASDPDGDAVSVKVSASGAGTVAGLVPSAIRWNGTPCPTGKSCYRATAWAGGSPGAMTITATVTANGKSNSDSATFPVKPDDFG